MESSSLHAGKIDCSESRMLAHDGTMHWLGVFARDQLPDLNRIPRPFALVLNTDPHDKPGQHWLGIFCPSKRRQQLFDSFVIFLGRQQTRYFYLKNYTVAYQSLNLTFR